MITTMRSWFNQGFLMRWVNSKAEQTEESAAELDDAQIRLQEALTTAKRISVQETVSLNEKDCEQLQFLVAYYLHEEKRRDHLPLDPVARFHLGNGASLDHVLPGADIFTKGLSQSAGVMVSYLYALDKVEDNHEAYANEQVVIMSAEVNALLNKPRRLRIRA